MRKTQNLEQGWPNHCPGAQKYPQRLFLVAFKLFWKLYFLYIFHIIAIQWMTKIQIMPNSQCQLVRNLDICIKRNQLGLIYSYSPFGFGQFAFGIWTHVQFPKIWQPNWSELFKYQNSLVFGHPLYFPK